MTRKQFVFIGFFTLSLFITGIILAQELTTSAFDDVMQIGQSRPRGIVYNRPYDQIAMTDIQGRLVLVNAVDFSVQHVIYEQQPINAYEFSHDGRYLAIALERRVEVWDAQTGVLDVALEPEGVLEVTGPLYFADDDVLLAFNSIVPEPAATRVSENDTTNLPWLWDLPLARREAQSTLPNRAQAYPFFDFRNGFVLGSNDIVIGPLPQRYQIIDVGNTELPVLSEIASSRRERDPITVWQSLQDDALYLQPINQNNIVQIDTSDGSIFEFLPGRQFSSYEQISQFNELVLSGQARIIGEPLSTTDNSFLRLLLGEDYRRSWNYHPITVILLDILDPVTIPEDQMGLLIYIYDETAGTGVVDFVRPVDAMHMALDPEETHLAVRRSSDLQAIEVYNLDTGILEQRIYPAIRDPEGGHLFAYDPTGTVILSDFERFDARTSEVLRQDITLSTGFESYYFTEDSSGLVTLRGSDWWLWDIETSEVIRQEVVALRGSIVSVARDASRYLTRQETNEGVIMEIVNVGMEARESVLIENIPARYIASVIPSPDWENFLVIYEAQQITPYSPGNEVAIYNIDAGQTLFMAGDDLPSTNGRQYGWVNTYTAYVASSSTGNDQTQRVYGVEYHVSGLPLCLVETFPNDWTNWLNVWEQLNANLRGDTLAFLTQRICNNLPPTADVFVDSLTPTPSTFFLVESTRSPAIVAGIPICLTSRFPNEALEFAELWRLMSEGLSDEETAELEVLLCEGLIGSVYGISATATPNPIDVAVELTTTAQALLDNPPTPTLDPNAGGTGRMSAMTINIETGVRSLGPYIPDESAQPRSLSLVLDEFERTHGFRLQNAKLSPDGTLLVGLDLSNFIVVYHLNTNYETISANATGTLSARQTGEPRSVSLRPTATQGFNEIGTPRPTLTATITPTPPPLSNIEFADQDDVEETCEFDSVDLLESPPPSYNATGHLLVRMSNSNLAWRLNVENGDLNPDETLPSCIISGGCTLSFDQQWILVQGDSIYVMRIDGSDVQVLYDELERPVFPDSIYWLPSNVIEFQYRREVPNRYSPVLFIQRYDPVTREYSERFEPYEYMEINELYTEYITTQPNDGSQVVVRTLFNTGYGTGYKYYIVDRDTEITDAIDYFARTSSDFIYEWHPQGRALYYTFTDSEDWYIYDTQTREHRLLGVLPAGIWSPDGRYRVNWYYPDIEQRLEEGLPLPKLMVWDSETGEIRHYCIPQTGFDNFGSAIIWSPDSRYIAFSIQFPVRGDDVLTPTPPVTFTPTPLPTLSFEEQRIAAFSHTLVMNLETGEITDLSTEAGELLQWIDVPEGSE